MPATCTIRRGRRSRRAATAAPVVGLAPLLLLLVIWQLVGSDQSVTFPPPSTWWSALRSLDDADVLRPAIVHTLWVFLLSLGSATVLGVVVGAPIGISRRLERAASPLMEFARAFPPPAAVPVGVLLLGPTLHMSVLVIVATAVWPIIINTVSATQRIPRVRIDVGRSLDIPPWVRFSKLIVPSVLPAVLLGVRVATPICFIVTLLAEMLASTPGLGQLLLQQQRLFDSQSVFALLALIAVLGLLINVAVARVEAFLLRNWPHDS